MYNVHVLYVNISLLFMSYMYMYFGLFSLYWYMYWFIFLLLKTGFQLVKYPYGRQLSKYGFRAVLI